MTDVARIKRWEWQSFFTRFSLQVSVSGKADFAITSLLLQPLGCHRHRGISVCQFRGTDWDCMNTFQHQMPHSCNAFSSTAAIFSMDTKMNPSALVEKLQKIGAGIWGFHWMFMYILCLGDCAKKNMCGTREGWQQLDIKCCTLMETNLLFIARDQIHGVRNRLDTCILK